MEEKERLASILDSAVDAIITIDEKGTIEVINPATTAMFGYTKSELIGQNIKLLMPSPYFEEHDGYLHRYCETGEKKIIGVGRQVLGRRKDGTIFPVHLAVSEYTSGGRRLFTGIVRDISDLKAAQDQLEKLNEQLEQRVREQTEELQAAHRELLKNERLATLGKVSGGIAHEIRNPLNAVKTSVYYLLHARNPTVEKTREHLQRVDRQVTLIDNVLTALTDVALMPEPKLQALEVSKQLTDALNNVGLPSNIVIDNRVPSDYPVLIWSDAHQFPIVLRNLIRNARDAMPNGGQITIDASARDSEVAISVQDTGVGIAPEHLPRITEPFFSTKARGMGLGLAISKAILEKNGARLEVESELGTGSIFRLIFPAAPGRQLRRSGIRKEFS